MVWLERSFNDFRHCPFCFKNFAMQIVELFEFWVMLYDAGRTDEMPLEVSAMPGEISFVLHGSLFEHEFYFVLGTNRKQTTCTNKFSMCFVETTV